ncbi:MAG: 16S rRNA (guanine(527)-N(7))-methyltransferase RsmG [Actinomycetota bacterium]|nr:16S rRNA (guanine(527)-N(7))-methyltransferase RsmG [Actinomycetota bacterium]
MRAKSRDLLVKGAGALKIELDEEKMKLFEIFLDEIVAGNKRAALTAITEEEEIASKHFLDSLSLKLVHDFSCTERVIDIGSGAGLPGLPLKIAFPHLNTILLDSIKKKVDFLQGLIERMGLDGIQAVCCRAEDYGINRDNREQFDLALARAVAPLSVLAEYALPILKIGGSLLAQKANLSLSEIDAAERGANELGGAMVSAREIDVPFVEAKRTIVIIKKLVPTPKQYPRRAGIPKKRPLGGADKG